MIWKMGFGAGRAGRAIGCSVLAIGAALLSARVAAATPPGDAARGARLFLQCRACHTVGATDPSGVGPSLWGVVGAKAASKPGYHYSAALSASAIVWTPANIDRWLTQPTAVVPGTLMAFQGVAAADARLDLIAYLSTLGPRNEAKGGPPATPGRR